MNEEAGFEDICKSRDREILEDEAVVNWVNPSLPTRQLIRDLMSYSAELALDPRVSQDAVNLYLQGYNDGKDQAAARY